MPRLTVPSALISVEFRPTAPGWRALGVRFAGGRQDRGCPPLYGLFPGPCILGTAHSVFFNIPIRRAVPAALPRH